MARSPRPNPPFGFERADYDALFAGKLDLLLALRARAHVHWSGRFRPALTGQGVYPRPLQPVLPVWLGAGGTPASFTRAGTLGRPLMLAIIGGTFERFAPLVALYREAGHPPEQLRLGLHVMGFLGDTMEAAQAGIFPGWLHAFTAVGHERGWPAPTRAQLDAACSPGGPHLVGDPDMVAAKIRAADRIFGGVARLSFQMSAASAGPAAVARAIELIGTAVAPALRTLRRQEAAA